MIITRFSLITAIVVLLIGGGALFFTASKEDSDQHANEARTNEIRHMVELATLEFHEEFTVKDTINGKRIAARETLQGSACFNPDSLQFLHHGDTTFVVLPKPDIELYENSADDTYEVLDIWDADHTLVSRTLTPEEADSLKRRWKEHALERMKNRGFTSQARENAVATLKPLFSKIQGAIVVVE